MPRVRSRSYKVADTYSVLENKMAWLQELFSNFASTESTPVQSVGLHYSPYNNKIYSADENTETKSCSANFCYMQWWCPQKYRSSVMPLTRRKLSLSPESQPSNLPHNFMLKLTLKTQQGGTSCWLCNCRNSSHLEVVLCIECVVRCHEKCVGTYQMCLWKVHLKGPIHSKLNCAV